MCQTVVYLIKSAAVAIRFVDKTLNIPICFSTSIMHYLQLFLGLNNEYLPHPELATNCRPDARIEQLPQNGQQE